jgi:hypothetical protein
MAWSDEFLPKLQFLWRRRQFDADLEEEVCLHLELRTAESGDLSAAQRQSGNQLLLREQSRESWGWTRIPVWHSRYRSGVTHGRDGSAPGAWDSRFIPASVACVTSESCDSAPYRLNGLGT